MGKSGSSYCSCGNPKYPDAMACEACWSRQAPYDERNPNWKKSRNPCPGCRGVLPVGADICQSCFEALRSRR